MLFNSFSFLLFFLPLTLLLFFRLGRLHPAWAAGWLAAASLFFYGWWNPAYVGLLLASIVFNFSIGSWIAKAGGQLQRHRRTLLLAVGIGADLLLLGYYKYANFFVSNLARVVASDFSLSQIVLPLGISFFTFTQIAFLVDAARGKVKEYSFVHYVLFVTYFPHLLAGPVLHHQEMMPQFMRPTTYRPSARHLAIGMTIFCIGLFKKVALADGVAQYVAPVFDGTAPPTPWAAWGAALAFALQLYFDFSGYSDMAIGLSRLFGVRLPLNFASPYKASNIIAFWRCWHMTLSRFLRDYLYIPLGGGRSGKARRYLNLMLTMLLGGLWHGAGWTFVIWGGLHGLYLVLNHFWQALRVALGQDLGRSSWLGRWAGRLLTFLAVVVAWVWFRATSVDSALRMLGAMFDYRALADAGARTAALRELWGSGELKWIVVLLAVAWGLPNTQQIMARARPALEQVGTAGVPSWLRWRPTPRWLAFAVSLLGTALYLMPQGAKVSEFLYFQF
jgi:D-alanyl-lipoteichoic acid acyltransferase DltB (MBOAT superfamily)